MKTADNYSVVAMCNFVTYDSHFLGDSGSAADEVGSKGTTYEKTATDVDGHYSGVHLFTVTAIRPGGSKGIVIGAYFSYARCDHLLLATVDMISHISFAVTLTKGDPDVRAIYAPVSANDRSFFENRFAEPVSVDNVRRNGGETAAVSGGLGGIQVLLYPGVISVDERDS